MVRVVWYGSTTTCESIPQSEDVIDRIIVVEVDKCDRSKITRYSQFDKTNKKLLFTLEMKMFVPKDPDPYYFEVPAVCFDSPLASNQYMYWIQRFI